MMSTPLCTTDLHLHTNLSFCAPKTTVAASYLPLCAGEGIRTVGISNHLYAAEKNGIDGVSYLDYALRIKDEITALRPTTDVRLLVGCEVETFPGQGPGLHPADAHHFDYVLLAPSHMFNQIYWYRDIDLSDADKVRTVMLERFRYACMLDYGVPTGICHPLYPICCPWEQEVVDGITDEELSDCFTLAKQTKKSIEIHACLWRQGTALDGEGLSPSYLRILSAAKAAGCKFHFGSDAHAPEAFAGVHAKLERAAERIGVGKEDLWEVIARTIQPASLQ